MSSAEATRDRILRATRTLLEAGPGAPISMGAIAEAAGVSRQLLYLHFENRTDLLVEASRMIDREARTPALQATIDDAPTGRLALRAAVEAQGVIKPQVRGIATSLGRLQGVDEAAAAAYDERESMRLERCRQVVARLVDDDALKPGWDPTVAAELLWSMTSLPAWEDLVIRRGWTTEAWVDRTVEALESTLLRDRR